MESEEQVAEHNDLELMTPNEKKSKAAGLSPAPDSEKKGRMFDQIEEMLKCEAKAHSMLEDASRGVVRHIGGCRCLVTSVGGLNGLTGQLMANRHIPTLGA